MNETTRRILVGFTAALLLAPLAALCAADAPKPAAALPTNANYPSNRAPLQPTAFVQLPLGAVQPRGWLKDQLQIQADGLTSWTWSAFDVRSFDANPPYHQEGVVALAYVLHDERLMALARGYVNRRLEGRGSRRVTFTNASIMRFLMEYQEATGDARIVPWMLKWYESADWKPLPGSWDYAGREEHLLALYWLYNRTGDARLLAWAKREFGGPANYRPELANAIFPISNVATIAQAYLDFPAKRPCKHGVELAWKLKYPGLYWQQEPKDEYRRAVFAGLDGLDRYFGQIAGRFAAHELLPDIKTGRNPTHGTELCNTVESGYNMERLFEIFGEPSFCDRLESLAFNTWPGEMTPDMWAHQYDTQATQVVASVADRGWDNTAWANTYGLEPHWTCCLANMHQAWPRFVKNMWMATPDNGLVAAAYGPCAVRAKVGASGETVTITEATDYPFDGDIKFTFKTVNSVAFPLRLRIPAWADGASIVNGAKMISAKAGTLVTVSRQWSDGDAITLRLPMRVRTEERFQKAIAVMRGPLYFALRIGQRYAELKTPNLGMGEDCFSAKPVRERSGFPVFDWEIFPTTPWNVGLLLDSASSADTFQVVRHPLGDIPFAQKGEPVIRRVSGDLGNAQFKAEVSRVQPHPAESDLATAKKAWRLADTEQWVGFNRETYTRDEPVVLKTKGRLVPQWTLLPGKNPVTGQSSPAIASAPPLSPVAAPGPNIEIELIPYGCTRLRISEFPIMRKE